MCGIVNVDNNLDEKKIYSPSWKPTSVLDYFRCGCICFSLLQVCLHQYSTTSGVVASILRSLRYGCINYNLFPVWLLRFRYGYIHFWLLAVLHYLRCVYIRLIHRKAWKASDTNETKLSYRSTRGNTSWFFRFCAYSENLVSWCDVHWTGATFLVPYVWHFLYSMSLLRTGPSQKFRSHMQCTHYTSYVDNSFSIVLR